MNELIMSCIKFFSRNDRTTGINYPACEKSEKKSKRKQSSGTSPASKVQKLQKKARQINRRK